MSSTTPTTISARKDWFKNDGIFHLLYPNNTRQLAIKHFTPLAVAKEAAAFLTAGKGSKILDIGSGAGKFCLAAAHFNPLKSFFGIEQRSELVQHANDAKEVLALKNAAFQTGNITDINLSDYDHFYFYNSFFENISTEGPIDDTVIGSRELFTYYTNHIYKQFEQLPADTRVVTYHSSGYEMPPSYYIVHSSSDDVLKFYIKI